MCGRLQALSYYATPRMFVWRASVHTQCAAPGLSLGVPMRRGLLGGSDLEKRLETRTEALVKIGAIRAELAL